jgi:hypothetical protein
VSACARLYILIITNWGAFSPCFQSRKIIIVTTFVDLTVISVASNFLPEQAQGNKQEVLHFLWAHKSDGVSPSLCLSYYYFATLKRKVSANDGLYFQASWRESVIVSHCFCGKASAERASAERARLFPHLAAAPFAFVTKSPTSSSLSLRRYRLSVKWCPLQLYLHHLALLFFPLPVLV